jgi:hypothetical protein
MFPRPSTLRRELAQDVAHLVAKAAQFVAVGLAEPRQDPAALRGERQPVAASIFAVDLAFHELCVHGSVHEFDDGVMLELEELSDIGDRRGTRFAIAPDREEELVLVWCEAFASSCFFGEP